MKTLRDALHDIARPLNAETLLGNRPVCRPYVDPKIGTHEGVEDNELAAMLELHAALLDTKGLHGIAHDVREGARRLAK